MELNVLCRTSRKHLIAVVYETTSKNMQQVQILATDKRTGLLQSMPQSKHEGMEKKASINSIATNENELQGLHTYLCETWEIKEIALRKMWPFICSCTSFGLFETIIGNLALPFLPQKASQGDFNAI